METKINRQRWPRVAVTLPPQVGKALDDLAEANFRDRRHEALRLLTDAIERERPAERSEQ
jgi:hypothetical protein